MNINIKDIASRFEEELQQFAADNEFDAVFTIYTTVGDRKASEREYGTNHAPNIIYGIYAASPTILTPISGMTLAQFSATVTFVCELHKLVGDNEIDADGNYANPEHLKALLDDFVQAKNGTVSDGMLIYYSLSTVGDAEITSSETGEIIPIGINIFYVIAEDGYFGEDIELYIDGIRIWYTAFAESKNKTLETALLDGRQTLEGIATEAVNGIDFTAPMTDKIAGVIAEEHLNTWHLVKVKKKDSTIWHKMIFGNRTINAEPTLVASVTASLIDCIERLATPADTIISLDPSVTPEVASPYTYDNTATLYCDSVYIMTNNPEATFIISWGDGTFEIATYTYAYSHTYAEAGSYTVLVAKCGTGTISTTGGGYASFQLGLFSNFNTGSKHLVFDWGSSGTSESIEEIPGDAVVSTTLEHYYPEPGTYRSALYLVE